MSVRSPAIAIAIAIALCASCAALAQDPASRYRVLSGPDCAGPQNIIAEEAREPLNATFLRVQHMGDPGTAELANEAANEVTWDVGQMTGLHTPAFAQRGHRDAPPPVAASAFQLACGDAGFLINSFEFTHTQPIEGAGQSVSIARTLEPWPRAFEDAQSRFFMQASIAVPTSYSPNRAPDSGVTAVSFMYYVVDATSGIALAHVIGLHDNRPAGVGGSGNEILANDGVTLFAASPLAAIDGSGTSVKFVEVPPQSGTIRYENGWTEPILFRADITYARFKSMLEALKPQSPAMSTDPLDYRIALFGVLGEVFVGTSRGHDVMLGGSVHGLTLARERVERRVGRFR
jgi:hypothetical protein